MSAEPPPLRPALPTLEQHAQAAREALDPATWAYLDGGSADELTLQDNAAAWRRLKLRPRVLMPLADGHTRVTLLGRSWPLPLLVAPMAGQAQFHPAGEVAVALAAAAQGAGLVLSGQSSRPAREVFGPILADAQRGPLWQQLVLDADLDRGRELLDDAVAAGAEAVVITVDAPVQGVRDREWAAGFSLDARWVHDPRQRVEATSRPRPGLCGGRLETALTWHTLERLRRHCPLPMLLKGIVHPDDAGRTRDLGCAGVIVSNHGGRALDTVPATADLLPAIAEAAGGRLAVLVDGGIRRGSDILKARCLGADAVLVGRPVLHGLAHAGAPGVAQVLRRLRDEFEIALALCGCRSPDQAGPALLAA